MSNVLHLEPLVGRYPIPAVVVARLVAALVGSIFFSSTTPTGLVQQYPQVPLSRGKIGRTSRGSRKYDIGSKYMYEGKPLILSRFRPRS